VFIQIHKKHRKPKNKPISAERPMKAKEEKRWRGWRGGEAERTKGGEGGGVGRGLGVSNR
jgi:hypothetical protein